MCVYSKLVYLLPYQYPVFLDSQSSCLRVLYYHPSDHPLTSNDQIQAFNVYTKERGPEQTAARRGLGNMGFATIP